MANRFFGTVFGAVYVLIGLAGFLVTGGVEFAGKAGGNLLGFQVNPLHNIVHILIGVVLIGGAAAGEKPSVYANGVVGGVLLVVAALGFISTDALVNRLALSGPDNILHLASAVLAIGFATGTELHNRKER